MNKKLLNSLSRALWDSDLITTRITLGLGELFWAVMLFWAGDTFSRPTYAHMAYIMNEELWGFVFLASSIVQIGIVLSEQFHTPFARVFAGWNALLWFFIVTSMLLSVYPPPAAIGGEIALAIVSVWIWLRPYILLRGYERATR